jgi:replicative DNA helicase
LNDFVDVYGNGGDRSAVGNAPVPITDLIISNGENENNAADRLLKRRIKIPDDDELNTVLGGGIMRGSLILIGGDPGVGSTFVTRNLFVHCEITTERVKMQIISVQSHIINSFPCLPLPRQKVR